MIKTGRVQIEANRIVFVAEGEMYIIPFELYKVEMLNQLIRCEVDSNPFRKIVTKIY